MQINSIPDSIAVILAVISFYGTTYLVVALNIGWRFGYWICGAVLRRADGPAVDLLGREPGRPTSGEEAAAGCRSPPGTDVAQASSRASRSRRRRSIPAVPWQPAKEGDEQADAFSSAVTTACRPNPRSSPEEEQGAVREGAVASCRRPEDIPVCSGSPVAVQSRVTEVRFATENGNLAQGVVDADHARPSRHEGPEGQGARAAVPRRRDPGQGIAPPAAVLVARVVPDLLPVPSARARPGREAQAEPGRRLIVSSGAAELLQERRELVRIGEDEVGVLASGPAAPRRTPRRRSRRRRRS